MYERAPNSLVTGPFCRSGAEPAERQREVRTVLGHRAQESLDELQIFVLLGEQADLPPQPSMEGGFEPRSECTERLLRIRNRAVLTFCEDGKERFRKPRQVPLGDTRLVGVRVAPVLVDRAEHCRRIVSV